MGKASLCAVEHYLFFKEKEKKMNKEKKFKSYRHAFSFLNNSYPCTITDSAIAAYQVDLLYSHAVLIQVRCFLHVLEFRNFSMLCYFRILLVKRRHVYPA